MVKGDKYAFLYAEFLGVGYVFDGNCWIVAVIFSKASEAQKIWKDQIETLDDNSLKLSFVEKDLDYKFILYSLPMLPTPKFNFGMYRTLQISKHYLKFKEESNGQSFLSFAVLGNNPEPKLLKGSKFIKDIKFLSAKDVNKNSPEWIAEEAQKHARADAKKERDYVR